MCSAWETVWVKQGCGGGSGFHNGSKVGKGSITGGPLGLGLCRWVTSARWVQESGGPVCCFGASLDEVGGGPVFRDRALWEPGSRSLCQGAATPSTALST